MDPLMDPSLRSLLERRRAHETRESARKIYDRILARGDGDRAGLFEAFADLADAHYKRGERHEALNDLECWRRLLGPADGFLANKLANKIEFLSGAAVLSSKPLKLEVSLTDRCDLRCVMCMQSTHGVHEIGDRNRDEILALIPYLESINWIGGEAFCSPHFEPLFDEAARRPRLRQNLITSGLRIDERWARKLASNRTSLLVSIDGFTPGTFESIRRGARFEDLLAALERVKEAFSRSPIPDIPDRLALNFVLMRRNLTESVRIVEFAARYGFNAVQISPLWPYRPSSDYEEQDVAAHPDLAAWFTGTALPRILKEGEDRGVLVRQVPAFARAAAARPAPPRARPAADPRLTCPYPWGSFFSDPEGRVKPYCLCGRHFAGNILEEPFEDIWNGEGMRRFRRLADDDSGELLCRRCDFADYRRRMKLCDPLW